MSLPLSSSFAQFHSFYLEVQLGDDVMAVGSGVDVLLLGSAGGLFASLLLSSPLFSVLLSHRVGFCREELTFEMLTLEPRASDDETLESEASIGTADSSENLNFDSEGAISDRSGESVEPVIREVSMRLFHSKALHRAT